MLKAFLVSVQFLTRLPVSVPAEVNDEHLGKSVLMYPFVGLIISAFMWIPFALFADKAAGVTAALMLVTWVLMTGAIHIDGLADSADAWLGGHGDRERTLEIMQDATSGPVAVSLVVLVLITKFAAITALIVSNAWAGWVIAPIVGRAAIIILFLTTPYVRADGIGSRHAEHMPTNRAVLVLLLVTGALLMTGWQGVWALIAATVVFYSLRYLMMARIGGTTGDTSGAMVEIIETTILVVFALEPG